MNVHCEWGRHGLDALASRCDVVVIVDVLSFSTAVEIATARGARVVPAPWKKIGPETWPDDGGPTVLAGPREGHGPSLSPASLLELEAGVRLVLPSPNGAELSARAPRLPVLAGCLRNASAVAEAARRLGDRIAVIPAGERWPDGSLRAAFEDWVGAGAILARLEQGRSPEAQAAVDAFVGARSSLALQLRQCASDLASELDVSDCVPRLSAQREYAAWRPRGSDS